MREESRSVRTAMQIPMVVPLLAGIFLSAVTVVDAKDCSESLALAMLPKVAACQTDDSGRILLLEGELNPGATGTPEGIALAFLRIHSDLYPRASGTTFDIATITRGKSTSVEVFQSVARFRRVERPVVVVVNEKGVVERIDGDVLRNEDVPAVPDKPLEGAKAIETAKEKVNDPGELLDFGAEMILFGEKEAYAWRVSLLFEDQKTQQLTFYSCVVDAVKGGVLSVEGADVTGMVAAMPQDPLVPNTESIVACSPFLPLVGEFATQSGSELWTYVSPMAGGSWEYDKAEQASLFRSNQLEYYCAGPGLLPCNHGQIVRDNVGLPPGYDRAILKLQGGRCFNEPNTLTLRWGPGQDTALTVPLGDACFAEKVDLEFNLASVASWDSSTVTQLAIESDGMFDGYFVSLDFYPGPWLEFGDDPEVPSAGVTSGVRFEVDQWVVNVGCQLPPGSPTCPRPIGDPQDPYWDMRNVEVTSQRMEPSGTSWIPVGEPEHLCNMKVCQQMGPGGTVKKSCSGSIAISGHYRIASRFRNHDLPGASTEIDVAAPLIPDLYVDPTVPVEAGFDHAGNARYRIDTLDLTTCVDSGVTKLLFTPVVSVSDVFEANVITSVNIYGKRHDPTQPYPAGECPHGGPTGWTLLGGEGDLPLTTGSSVAVPLTSCSHILPVDVGSWHLVDLWIEIESVEDEQNVANNSFCIPRWMPAARNVSFAETVAGSGASVLVDEDYISPSTVEYGPKLSDSAVAEVVMGCAGVELGAFYMVGRPWGVELCPRVSPSGEHN